MCGIAAIFSHDIAAPAVDSAELLRIREAMVRRGPDGAGLWLSRDQRVGLAHRRLAIVDLTDRGAQPMATADGSIRITFNGEIYNYQELKQQLEAKGYRFHSQSDTEVLLHLYADRGAEMVHVLRGMYAFAIWDERNKGLFLARDPFGIKPLYYADDGSTIRVASQVKALMAGGAVSSAPSPAGHVGYFLWGHVPDPFTLYQNIRALPAGHHMWVSQAGRSKSNAFFNIANELQIACSAEPKLSRDEMREQLRDALLDSVRHHLIADVPVGIFLSAGLDSTTLTALARECGNSDLRTVTLGFKEYAGHLMDEVPLAEAVARQYGASQSTSWVQREDFKAELQNVIEAMDQPSTDGINAYFVSKAAKAAGLKVAISGVGGDELFGSYPSFRQIPLMCKLVGSVPKLSAIGTAVRIASEPLLKHFASPKYAGLFEYGGSFAGAYLLRRGMYMPWELPSVVDPQMLGVGWDELATIPQLEATIFGVKNTHLKVTALESVWYMRNQLLRDTDWASMALSLEIRTPLIDIDLFRATAKLLVSSNPPTKLDMANSPGRSLPSQVLSRPKTGFVVPIKQWLLEEPSVSAHDVSIRGWSRRVLAMTGHQRPKILALVTDSYGCTGGIAKFNRDLIEGIAKNEGVSRLVVIPRRVALPLSDIPQKVDFRCHAAGGKLLFIREVARVIWQHEKFDLVVCGHINLLPVAFAVSRLLGLQTLLIGHGIDVWQPTSSQLVNWLSSKIEHFVSVSSLTLSRFQAWSRITSTTCYVLPNCFDPGLFSPGPKEDYLLSRYGLSGKTVLLTVGRLASKERSKGFDVVLDCMPRLLQKVPELAYLIVGDGDDRLRLQAKAKRLGIGEHVVFAGYISEKEKHLHYRLADAYVMPSMGEGFGIVFLEAMACGVPTLGSKVDGGREALRDGTLGILVDPMIHDDVIAGICTLLAKPKIVPTGLSYFERQEFENRLNVILSSVLRSP